jgi:hypothetical protein
MSAELREARLARCDEIDELARLGTEVRKSLFKLPLSGDVVQWIKPLSWWFSGSQITANVYLGD